VWAPFAVRLFTERSRPHPFVLAGQHSSRGP
jgi:hypothetical protein